MGPDDGEDACRVLMVAVEDGVRGLEPRVEGDTQRTMGDVTTAVPPPPGKRVEPRAGGTYRRPNHPASARTTASTACSAWVAA